MFKHLSLYDRLYAKGRILGHKRAKRNTRPNTSLLQIEGVATKEDAQFYLGKRVAYVYKGKKEIQGSNIRVIWGWAFFLVSACIFFRITEKIIPDE